MIVPNSERFYLTPRVIDDVFQIGGLRYIRSSSSYFVSVLGSGLFLLPMGTGFYRKIFAQDFNKAKERLIVQQREINFRENEMRDFLDKNPSFGGENLKIRNRPLYDVLYAESSHLNTKESKQQLSFQFE